MICCLVMTGLIAMAQSSPLKMVSFHKIPNDFVDLVELKQRVGRDCDFDSNKAALIRVKAQGFTEKTMYDFSVFPQTGLEIIDKMYKDGELWLYVSSKCLGTIIIKYMGDFAFALPSKLEPKSVYELTLGMETATLILLTTPEESEIFIDNAKVGTGSVTTELSTGIQHVYRVECENYITASGTVILNKGDVKKVTVDLDPEFGYITINTNPEGADIYIEGKKIGQTPYMAQRIKRGRKMIELRKDLYKPFAQMITIKIGEFNQELSEVKLAPNYAEPVISTSADASIYVNNELKGTGRWTGKVNAGTYTIEARKAGCRTTSKSVTLNVGDKTAITLEEPLAVTGNMIISSKPEGADVSVDNDYKGKAPQTLNKIPIGNHTVSVSMSGYSTVNQTVEVLENKTANVNIELKKPSANAATASNSNTSGTSLPSDVGPYYCIEKGFFPVKGVIPGVTTTDQLDRLGFPVSEFNSKCHKDKAYSMGFWDHNEDKVCEYIAVSSLGWGGVPIPNEWVKIGMDYSMSYNEWLSFFRSKGLTISVINEPKVERWDGRRVLRAEFVAKAPDGIEFDMSFGYGNKKGEGYDVNSKNTLDDITIRNRKPLTYSQAKAYSSGNTVASSRPATTSSSAGSASYSKLFPLWGITFGKTTIDDVQRMGYSVESDKKYKRVKVNKVSFYDWGFKGTINYMGWFHGEQDFPAEWKQLGFNWTNSYDEWMSVFKKMGCTIEVTDAPHNDTGNGRTFLRAEFYATTPDGKIMFDMSFSYGDNGAKTSSPSTLNYFHIHYKY